MLDAISVAWEIRSQFVRNLVDPDNGINPRLVANLTAYGAEGKPFDFSTSGCLWQANVSPVQLDQTSVASYPMIMVYTVNEQNRHDARFATFSGDILLVVDLHLAWKKSKAQRDMESYPDAVSAALQGVLYQSDWNGINPRDLSVTTRAPVVLAATDWLQSMRVATNFEINA